MLFPREISPRFIYSFCRLVVSVRPSVLFVGFRRKNRRATSSIFFSDRQLPLPTLIGRPQQTCLSRYLAPFCRSSSSSSVILWLRKKPPVAWLLLEIALSMLAEFTCKNSPVQMSRKCWSRKKAIIFFFGYRPVNGIVLLLKKFFPFPDEDAVFENRFKKNDKYENVIDAVIFYWELHFILELGCRSNLMMRMIGTQFRNAS